jgi:hypothetical protein
MRALFHTVMARIRGFLRFAADDKEFDHEPGGAAQLRGAARAVSCLLCSVS